MTLEAIIMCLALNVYYEARGEPTLGQIAVAHVTLNRARNPNFPSNVCEVVREPRQFSWTIHKQKPPRKEELDSAKLIARNAILGKSADPTNGATHFHTTNLKTRWGLRLTAWIGNHKFYKN